MGDFVLFIIYHFESLRKSYMVWDEVPEGVGEGGGGLQEVER